MIRSMTAFARAEARGDFGLIACELRSVNHRFLEPGFRLPDVLRDLEFPLRERLRQTLTRGKVDVQIRYEAADSHGAGLELDRELAAQYVRAAGEIDQLARHAAPLNATDVLRLPGVVRTREPDLAALHTAALKLFDTALEQFVAMREREGRELARLIEERLAAMVTETEKVRVRMPAIMAHYRERLLNRLVDVRAELSPERLEQEMILFAQKIDVAEEMDRLCAHVAEIRRVLAEAGPVGRRLDFLMQELNREANTLGSKSVSADSSLSSVELKVLIEQMREQIQNIE
ncbi:MAG TPA: YicC/YloC family endoribonuclease [Moraxellaceae bacterium]|nr:YicC/YloC family endoribonuclease [Moraxellaceae bacterium]